MFLTQNYVNSSMLFRCNTWLLELSNHLYLVPILSFCFISHLLNCRMRRALRSESKLKSRPVFPHREASLKPLTHRPHPPKKMKIIKDYLKDFCFSAAKLILLNPEIKKIIPIIFVTTLFLSECSCCCYQQGVKRKERKKKMLQATLKVFI